MLWFCNLNTRAKVQGFLYFLLFLINYLKPYCSNNYATFELSFLFFSLSFFCKQIKRLLHNSDIIEASHARKKRCSSHKEDLSSLKTYRLRSISCKMQNRPKYACILSASPQHLTRESAFPECSTPNFQWQDSSKGTSE